MKSEDRDNIVSALAMHSVFSIKAEMDQMVTGLNDYGLGRLAQSNPEVLRQLFVHYRQLYLLHQKYCMTCFLLNYLHLAQTSGMMWKLH